MSSTNTSIYCSIVYELSCKVLSSIYYSTSSMSQSLKYQDYTPHFNLLLSHPLTHRDLSRFLFLHVYTPTYNYNCKEEQICHHGKAEQVQQYTKDTLKTATHVSYQGVSTVLVSKFNISLMCIQRNINGRW